MVCGPKTTHGADMAIKVVADDVSDAFIRQPARTHAPIQVLVPPFEHLPANRATPFRLSEARVALSLLPVSPFRLKPLYYVRPKGAVEVAGYGEYGAIWMPVREIARIEVGGLIRHYYHRLGVRAPPRTADSLSAFFCSNLRWRTRRAGWQAAVQAQYEQALPSLRQWP